MSHLLRLLVSATLIGVLVVPVTAQGWDNGDNGGMGFGTHDWIVQEAYELAASNGTGWLKVAVARNASDDPDTRLNDAYHHAYDVSGDRWGDGPQHIRWRFEQAALIRDEIEASAMFGLLAHYYADITNPLNTDSSPNEFSMYAAYESDVETRTDSKDENEGWIVPDGLTTVTDVEATAIAAATDAHASYATLVDQYRANGFDSTVESITIAALNRAVNDLADILDTLENAPPSIARVDRIAGTDRYRTATAISQEAFPNGSDTVIISTALNWPDALGGSALAGAAVAPILLTHPAFLNPQVENEIARLGASRAYILGGPGAVSVAVEATLKGMLGDSAVTRIGGDSRYETARLIASEVVSLEEAESDGVAFVSTAANFPDALAASPLAARQRWPIYLSPGGAARAPTWLTEALASDGVSEVIILGSSTAVSDGVEADLVTALGASNVSRLEGPDRYRTATAIAKYGWTDLGMSWSGLALTTGTNFPDALAGGVLQALRNSVVVLAPAGIGGNAWSRLETDVFGRRELIGSVTVLGGPSAMSNAIFYRTFYALDRDFRPPGQKATTIDVSLNDYTPSWDSIVRLTATVRDQYGIPINGARVNTIWRTGSHPPTRSGVTDSDGVATIDQYAGSAPADQTTWVDASCSFGGGTATARTSFVMHW